MRSAREQVVHNAPAFVGAGVGHEALQLGHGRDLSDQIEMCAAQVLGIIGKRSRLNLGARPSLGKFRIDICGELSGIEQLRFLPTTERRLACRWRCSYAILSASHLPSANDKKTGAAQQIEHACASFEREPLPCDPPDVHPCYSSEAREFLAKASKGNRQKGLVVIVSPPPRGFKE